MVVDRRYGQNECTMNVHQSQLFILGKPFGKFPKVLYTHTLDIWRLRQVWWLGGRPWRCPQTWLARQQPAKKHRLQIVTLRSMDLDIYPRLWSQTQNTWTRSIWNPFKRAHGVRIKIVSGYAIDEEFWFSPSRRNSRLLPGWVENKCRRTFLGLGTYLWPQGFIQACECANRVWACITTTKDCCQWIICQILILYLGWRALAQPKSGKASKWSHAAQTQINTWKTENSSADLLLLWELSSQAIARADMVDPLVANLVSFTILAILAVLRHTARKSTFYQQCSLSSNLPQMWPRCACAG